MENRKLVGARIKLLRERRGLTQEKLAELIDRSVDGVSVLERGISLPNFETLQRLSACLDVPIKDFFEDHDEPDPKRALLLASILDIARSLPDGKLRVALRQIEALKDA